MEASSHRPVAAERPVTQLARYWWMPLIAGIAWLGIAYVVLQFDRASITTVGVLVGIMFLFSGVEQLALAGMVERGKWVYAIFGVLFLAAGIVALINPEETFAGIADILGVLFLLVGTFWIIQAFGARRTSELWWIGLVSGILMLILAFWTSGQFYVERAYTLLVFAGIWALMQAVGDIVLAFHLRELKAGRARDT